MSRKVTELQPWECVGGSVIKGEKMEYIKATDQNIDCIFNIVQNTVTTVYPKYYPKEVVDFFCELHSRENIAKDIENGNVGVLVGDNRIVGTGSHEENHITRVYVLPEYQGKGYGSFIMQCLEEEISEKYYTVLLDASLPASHLYEQRGYRTIKHEKWHVENDVVLVYEVMEKCYYTIREIRKNEYSCLNDFLYEAIFIPERAEAPDRSIINEPELQVYVADFGNEKDDICFVAEVDKKIIGAVWVRDMKDYGHIEDGVPSFALSLYKEFRGHGIGTELMKRMLTELGLRGYKKASLAVQKANYAVGMYKKLGFEIVGENEEEFIMVYRF